MNARGLYCDVVPKAGRFLLVSTQGDDALTLTDEDGALVARVRTLEPPWHLRAAALTDGAICAIGNGHRSGLLQVVIVQASGTISASQVAGLVSWGQCIEGHGDHWRGAVQLSPAHWQRLTIWPDGRVECGPVEPVPVWPGGDGTTSQGFLQMIDGEPVWSDPNRVTVIEGRTLILPVRAGEAVVGQTEDGAWWVKPGGFAGRAIPGDAMWPRIAQDGDRYACCAWTYPDTNTRTVIGPPYPQDAVTAPVLPTVPAALRGRTLWLGYFHCISDRPFGDNPSAPGNCTVVLTQDEARRSPWPYYALPGIGDGPRKIANWINVPAGDPWPDISVSDVALYDGGSRLPETPCPGGITALEVYSDPGEPLAAVEARMRQWLTRWPAFPVILVGQAYTRNGTELDQQKLADLQGLPLRLVVDYPQIRGIWWFSDGRPTGTRDNEWWRPVHTEAAALVRSPWEGAMPEWECGDILARYVVTFPVPQQQVNEETAAFEQRCREWSIMFARQVAYEKPNQGYGMKAQSATSPVSKDTLARQMAPHLYVWDLLMGVSTGSPVLVTNPSTIDATGQHFWPVQPTNYLGPVVPPVSNLEARVSALEDDLMRLKEAMTGWIIR